MTTDTTTTTTAPRLSVRPFDKYATRDELQKTFAARGSHYFDKETRKFFGARLCGVKVCPLGLAFIFIESTYTGFDRVKRGHRVRLATAWGEVFDFDSAGAVCRSTNDEYATIGAARKLFAKIDAAKVEKVAALWSAAQAHGTAVRALQDAQEDLESMQAATR